MKAETFYLANEDVRINVVTRIMQAPVDGSVKVVLSNAGTKSARQRGLQWKWYTEVSAAGIGGKHEDTKAGVHILSKWRWAIPILIRDDEFFADLFSAWKAKHESDEDAMRWFTDVHVSTEKLSTSQMAEYLTDFQRHYGPTVNLTDPDLFGLESHIGQG